MKIYTKGGDHGETTLFGGVRVLKTDPRVEAYGALDEFGAALGLALALDTAGLIDREAVGLVQEDLFVIGARLAAADPRKALEKGTIPALDPRRIDDLERWIDALDDELPALDAFILPGGCSAGAQLHAARTICRRAERAIVALTPEQPELRDLVLPYMNRLSDLLFTLARYTNRSAGQPERRWLPQREREEN